MTTTYTKPNPYPQRITLRLPARLHARLAAVAAAHGLRPSEVVRVGLAAELARLERDTGPTS